MFYSEPNKEGKKKDDNIVPFAIAAMVLVACAVVHQKISAIEQFYFRKFEIIWLSIYGILAAVAMIAAYSIVKRTKHLTERANLLSQLDDGPGKIFVAQTSDGVDLYLSDAQRCAHLQLLGSTGRGKTKSVIEPWISRDIKSGKSIILIDGKGDPKILSSMRKTAKGCFNNPKIFVFDLGNSNDSCATNPLAHGSSQQITDRLFTAFKFDESYYRAIQFDVASSAVQLIQESNETVTFKRFYELLTDDIALSKAVSESKNESLRKRLTRFLTMPKNAREENFSGLLSQIAPFAEGEIAPLVNGPTKERPQSISISNILLSSRDFDQRVFVLLIPTLKYQQIGHQLGRLLLQELGWAVGERASQKEECAFVPVYLDEFSSFVYDGFTNILNKARSSLVALHLSHQSLGDLSVVSPEFGQIITTNTNIKCILGLNDPESADFMARHMGTKTQEKLTERALERGFFPKRERTGELSVREVEAYKIHPNLLKNYTNGKGVLHLPSPKGNITEEVQFVAISEDL